MTVWSAVKRIEAYFSLARGCLPCGFSWEHAMKMIGFNKGSSVDEQDGLFDMTGGMPVPGPRDVLVRVRAVGVNPLD
ncbi:MAG: hypothetical protein RSF79_18820, partial [Janthinobacterium sp.]